MTLSPAPPPEPEEPDDEPDLEVDTPIPGSLLLDIREPVEIAYGHAEGAMLLPMDLVPHHLADLPRDRPITVYCAAGSRSFGTAHWLRQQGFDAWSLAPGVHGLPLRRPDGPAPGSLVTLPADAKVDGIPVGGLKAEVIGEGTARVRDGQGFWVRVRL